MQPHYSSSESTGSNQDAQPASMIRLRMFVAEHGPTVELAITQLTELCQQWFGTRCQIDVVDVLENPQAAEDNQILATPTLVRESPLPRRFVIGDLLETERILAALELAQDS